MRLFFLWVSADTAATKKIKQEKNEKPELEEAPPFLPLSSSSSSSSPSSLSSSSSQPTHQPLNGFACGECKEKINNPHIAPCGHSYCLPCVHGMENRRCLHCDGVVGDVESEVEENEVLRMFVAALPPSLLPFFWFVLFLLLFSFLSFIFFVV